MSSPKPLLPPSAYHVRQPPTSGAFLRWAGSKRKTLPRLMATVHPEFDRYVEPFAGSACLFFELKPSKAVLSDINEDLISTYLQVRDSTAAVARALMRIPTTSRSYYAIRAQDTSSLTPIQRAARFIFLNRFCFNGLYRTNLNGKFNVPFGGKRCGLVPSLEKLRECAKALRHASIFARPFEETLELVRVGDFVYLDPPYCIKSRRVFNAYSNASFGPDQLLTLKHHLHRVDRLGVPFLVSYGHSREALELAKGFRVSHLVVQRQIAGFAAKRRIAREIIITNY